MLVVQLVSLVKALLADATNQPLSLLCSRTSGQERDNMCNPQGYSMQLKYCRDVKTTYAGSCQQTDCLGLSETCHGTESCGMGSKFRLYHTAYLENL